MIFWLKRFFIENLIWKNGDATFDEDKLLAASERRVLLYHTNASDGDYSGARYSSNSRYQFPSIFNDLP